MNGHARNDYYSLLLHREAAAALASDADLLLQARHIVTEWKRRNTSAPRDWDEWLRLIDQGVEATIHAMTAENERSSRLRQSSPFSALVPARRRWALLKEAGRESHAA